VKGCSCDCNYHVYSLTACLHGPTDPTTGVPHRIVATATVRRCVSTFRCRAVTYPTEYSILHCPILTPKSGSCPILYTQSFISDLKSICSTNLFPHSLLLCWRQEDSIYGTVLRPNLVLVNFCVS